MSRQGRQDSNLQPPVLETGALPIELLPSARRIVPAPRRAVRGAAPARERGESDLDCAVAAPRRRSLGVLFTALTALFVGLAAYAAVESQWIVAACAGVLGIWMADLAYRSVR